MLGFFGKRMAFLKSRKIRIIPQGGQEACVALISHNLNHFIGIKDGLSGDAHEPLFALSREQFFRLLEQRNKCLAVVSHDFTHEKRFRKGNDNLAGLFNVRKLAEGYNPWVVSTPDLGDLGILSIDQALRLETCAAFNFVDAKPSDEKVSDFLETKQ